MGEFVIYQTSVKIRYWKILESYRKIGPRSMVFKAIFSRIRWRWLLKWRILAIEEQIIADTRKMMKNYPATLMKSASNPEQTDEKFKEYENRCKEVRALALEIGWHEKWEEYENRLKVLAETFAEGKDALNRAWEESGDYPPVDELDLEP